MNKISTTKNAISDISIIERFKVETFHQTLVHYRDHSFLLCAEGYCLCENPLLYAGIELALFSLRVRHGKRSQQMAPSHRIIYHDHYLVIFNVYNSTCLIFSPIKITDLLYHSLSKISNCLAILMTHDHFNRISSDCVYVKTREGKLQSQNMHFFCTTHVLLNRCSFVC